MHLPALRDPYADSDSDSDSDAGFQYSDSDIRDPYSAPIFRFIAKHTVFPHSDSDSNLYGDTCHVMHLHVAVLV